MTTDPSRRITWIDTLKGIGVTLVILGHTVGVPQLVLQLILACHIPIYTIISIIVLIPVSLFLKKYFPSLVGKVKKQDNQAFFIRQSTV